MDSKVLFEAAWEGNVEVFRKILKENPSVVIDVALSFPSESLLHVATKSGQVDFVRELINHDHELAKELNKDGFRALDIASMMGNVELVKEFVKNDHGICRLKGKDQRTALHYATIKGRIEVIDELLSTCPQAIEDSTVQGETALHLAVKNYQSDAFRLLVSWLGKLNMEAIINSSDRNGNTVLHLAASRKQVDTIELLLNNNNSMSEIVEVNATNLKGLTAMDVVDTVIESPNDLHLKETFQRAGALDAQHANTISTASPHQAAKTEGAKNVLQPKSTNCWPKCLQSTSTNYWLKHLKLEKERDSPKVRNELLIVAALIATVTFQAGVDPPDGIREKRLHHSLLESKAITFLFVFANTMGLTASLSIVTYLTINFPFQRELLISMVSMIFAYGFAIASVTDDGILYTFLASAFIITFFQRWVIVWGGKIRKARDKLPVTSKAITHDGGSGTNS